MDFLNSWSSWGLVLLNPKFYGLQSLGRLNTMSYGTDIFEWHPFMIRSYHTYSNWWHQSLQKLISIKSYEMKWLSLVTANASVVWSQTSVTLIKLKSNDISPYARLCLATSIPQSNTPIQIWRLTPLLFFCCNTMLEKYVRYYSLINISTEHGYAMRDCNA